VGTRQTQRAFSFAGKTLKKASFEIPEKICLVILVDWNDDFVKFTQMIAP
jgi:hypothetical protein